jgi:mRNA interferase RelE/StbE
VSSGWKIEYEGRARKQLKKLDRTAAIRIVRDLEEDLARTGDPRAFGKALVGEWSGFWRYRIGEYRAIAKIEDDIVTIFIIEVAYRRDVYR